MQKEQTNDVSMVIEPEQAQGVYSNMAVISHSPSEFVLDFASMLPGMPKPKVVSRVVLSPEHAKRLLLALQDNIVKYESENGRIEIKSRNEQSNSSAELQDIGFNMGEA